MGIQANVLGYSVLTTLKNHPLGGHLYLLDILMATISDFIVKEVM